VSDEDEELTLEEYREQLREGIRGAFYSLAVDDKGLHTHMVAAYVEYYMAADHEPLSPQEQVSIIGIVHTTILKMLHANPSSLQMATAHTIVHALADTYMSPEDDEEDEPDLLLEESADDLAAWADELNEFLKEQKEDDGDTKEGPPQEDG
jgi:hypothetical protein